MEPEDYTRSSIAHRSETAVAAVLPRSVTVRCRRADGHTISLKLNGKHITVKWIGEGGLRQARELIADRKSLPEVVVARRLSPGARETLSAVGVGWVDETGAAEIALGSLIVSRSGRPSQASLKPPRWTPAVLAVPGAGVPAKLRLSPRWTPAVLAVAEALLCSGKATVSAVRQTTGLSAGGAANALRSLSDLGLLGASARRGRNSGRSVPDSDRLLDEYATAAAALAPATALTVGVTWRDLEAGLTQTGHRWTETGIVWAATGSLAAMILAPYLTTVTTAEVYVDRETIPALESVAAQAGLRAIEGGRLILRPFPTVTSKRLAVMRDGMRLVPWPRVYADLRVTGVRGEEAAEHLRKVMRGE